MALADLDLVRMVVLGNRGNVTNGYELVGYDWMS